MYPKMFGVFLQALKNNCYEKRFVIQKKKNNSISLKKQTPESIIQTEIIGYYRLHKNIVKYR